MKAQLGMSVTLNDTAEKALTDLSFEILGQTNFMTFGPTYSALNDIKAAMSSAATSTDADNLPNQDIQGLIQALNTDTETIISNLRSAHQGDPNLLIQVSQQVQQGDFSQLSSILLGQSAAANMAAEFTQAVEPADTAQKPAAHIPAPPMAIDPPGFAEFQEHLKNPSLQRVMSDLGFGTENGVTNFEAFLEHDTDQQFFGQLNTILGADSFINFIDHVEEIPKLKGLFNDMLTATHGDSNDIKQGLAFLESISDAVTQNGQFFGVVLKQLESDKKNGYVLTDLFVKKVKENPSFNFAMIASFNEGMDWLSNTMGLDPEFSGMLNGLVGAFIGFLQQIGLGDVAENIADQFIQMPRSEQPAQTSSSTGGDMPAQPMSEAFVEACDPKQEDCEVDNEPSPKNNAPEEEPEESKPPFPIHLSNP